MTTTLTNTGWTGLANGLWSDGANTVLDANGGFIVLSGTVADTRSGGDSLQGSGGSIGLNIFTGATLQKTGTGRLSVTAIGADTGINNDGTFQTVDGNESLSATGENFGLKTGAGSILKLGNGANTISGTATNTFSAIFGTPNYYGIFNRGTIETGLGSDTITGIAGDIGINNSRGAIIRTGSNAEARDTITGTGGFIGINNEGIIETGDGRDTITGNGNGIRNAGNAAIIRTGNGNDTITGSVTGGGFYGIINDGQAKIEAGNDNKKITGSGSVDGILNRFGSTIQVGTGTNTISGTGGNSGINNAISTIVTGDGADTITGTATGTTGTGIRNEFGSTIQTGGGTDVLTGRGTVGIYNDGTINLGNGNNTVAALTSAGTVGTITGTGNIIFGTDQDRLRGFGTGNFSGGGGTDIVELPTGSYTVGSATVGVDTFVTFTSGGITMNVTEFETLRIGSKSFNVANLIPSTIVTG
ncbi:beta strand repeat-containing protein [Floridanema evergladense]|uniref:Beta strand repeat-containing protein n=1 Tax=Floridaenema evergladense BLCC-F167 TaxID=3153639 RepID=A0ABV4WHD9_9CYAN